MKNYENVNTDFEDVPCVAVFTERRHKQPRFDIDVIQTSFLYTLFVVTSGGKITRANSYALVIVAPLSLAIRALASGGNFCLVGVHKEVMWKSRAVRD